MPHLFVDISAHGFGHLAQVGPVLDALAARLPELRLTIRCGLPREKLVSRIAAPFDHLRAASDVAFPMHDAVRVDREASAVAYRSAHADWGNAVEREADFLRNLRVDAVFSDVSALPLAGAAHAGIPAMAMCSLNWADQLNYLFAGEAWAAPILVQLREAYASAAVFLRCVPAMPMDDLPNTREIPPVVRLGRSCRAALDERPGVSGERWVVVAMGGLGFDFSLQHWPQIPDVRWLVPASVALDRADVTDFEALGVHFTDLLASADALVTKPGYGSFVEAAAMGVPLLYLRRDDWPEQEVLIEWLQANAVCAEMSSEAFAAGQLLPLLEPLWAAPRPPVRADGAAVAAEVLVPLLSKRIAVGNTAI